MSMRAAVIREVGSSPELMDFDEPTGDDGELVVQVELAGLNPADLWRADGVFSGGTPATPYVAGGEGVGRVGGDGPLCYFGGAIWPYGSFAPTTLVQPNRLIELPEGMDPAQAVALGVAGQAGWLSVTQRSGLQAGEKVIVLGASSIVGQVAVTAARDLGAGQIVAVARSEAGLERALAAGADTAVQLDGNDDLLRERLVEAAGGPADIVIDILWGPAALAALAATGRGGRLVQIGNAAGEAEVTLPANLLRGGAREIRGHTNGAVPAAIRRDAYMSLCRRSISGRLKIEVEELSLERIGEAWDRQRHGPGRKLVIRP